VQLKFHILFIVESKHRLPAASVIREQQINAGHYLRTADRAQCSIIKRLLSELRVAKKCVTFILAGTTPGRLVIDGSPPKAADSSVRI
jgi:hypothetical protein